jgi:multicomponent Na+:H+ antiporter subunit B
MSLRSGDLPRQSLILEIMIGMLYPFMLMLGIYIILNGHRTPGGGFQGGSVIAALFIARYVIYPANDMSSERMHALQRFILALILITPVLLLFTGFIGRNPEFRTPYLVIMNILIGIQVGLELGVAILRFAFFEGVGKQWRL